MNLLDSLSSNLFAQSPVQLTLNPEYKRKYTSLYKSVFNLEYTEGISMPTMASDFIPIPRKRSFHLMAQDVTPVKSVNADKKSDRTPVYSPTKIPGQKPITIGHKYSFLVSLPEKTEFSPPWVIPLDARRVKSSEKDYEVGSAQIKNLLQNPSLPYGNELTMIMGDTAYGARKNIKSLENELKKTFGDGQSQQFQSCI